MEGSSRHWLEIGVIFASQHRQHATLPQAPADLQVKYDELVQWAIQEGMTFSAVQLDWSIQLQTP